MLTRQVESSQKRVEGNNYDTRESVLEYDEVMRKRTKLSTGPTFTNYEDQSLESDKRCRFVVQSTALRKSRQIKTEPKELWTLLTTQSVLQMI